MYCSSTICVLWEYLSYYVPDVFDKVVLISSSAKIDQKLIFNRKLETYIKNVDCWYL